MTERGENPPAFPRDHRHLGHNGMTLRDWFAGQVLASAAALPFGAADCINRAKAAYEQADAMLAARSKPAEPAPEPRMQRVAYFDEGQFHWMSGVAPRDCELFAKAMNP